VVAAFLLIYWTYLRPDPPLRVIAVSVNYQLPHAPPVPFASLDARRIAALASKAEMAQTGDGLRQLVDEYLPQSNQQREVLLVYVSAHGVSRDGKGMLLDGEDHRPLELEKLLDAVRRHPASLKLLVLDSGWIESDPRRGMVVNEFPLLLKDLTTPSGGERADQRAHDPRLWIINSNDFLQRSHVSFRRRASLLARALEQAIRGQTGASPAGSSRGPVVLGDLAQFVEAQIEQMSRDDSGGNEQQRPILLHDGQGEVTAAKLEMDAGIFVTLGVPNPVDPSTVNQAGVEGTDGDRAVGGGVAPDAPPKAESPWQRRDALLATTWRRVDFRPQSWRKENERLLGSEWLEWGDEGDRKASEEERASVVRSWEATTDTWDETEAARSFTRIGVDEAIRLRNATLFKLPYLIQWLACNRLDALGSSEFELLEKLLDPSQDLPFLIRTLNEPDVDSPNAWLKRLGETAASVEKQVKKIEAAFERGITAACGKRGNVYEIMDLLATPLPSSGQRERLLEALRERSKGDAPSKRRSAGVDDRAVWQRLTRAAALEWLVVRRLDLVAQGPSDMEIDRILDQVRNRGAELDPVAVRPLGRVLQGCYQEPFPPSFDADAINREWDPAGNMAELKLRLLPAHESVHLRAGEKVLTERRYPKFRVRPIDVVVTPTVDDGSGVVRLDWSIVSHFGKLPDEFMARLECDDSEEADALALFTDAAPDRATADAKNQDDPIAEGDAKLDAATNLPKDARGVKWSQWWQVKPRSDGREASGACWLRLKQGKDVRAVNLTFQVQGVDARPQAVTAQFVDLPDLEWQVVRYGDPNGKPFEKLLSNTRSPGDGPGRSRIELLPYCGAPTEFGIGLSNASGRARSVSCTFYRIPPPDAGQAYRWDLPWDEQGFVVRACKELAAPTPLKLEPRQTINVTFPSPPPEAASKTEAAVAIDASHGFVCVAEEARSSRKVRYLVWLEARRPLHPRAYITQPEVNRNVKSKAIEVRTVENEHEPFRKGGSTASATVWVPSSSGRLENFTRPPIHLRPLRDASVTTPVPQFPLGDFTGTATVWVAVDDYPRAFVFKVNCRGGDDLGLLDLGPRIEFVAPNEDEAFRSRIGEVPFELQCDAPPDFFGEGRRAGELRLRWAGEGPSPSRRFDRDRETRVDWRKAEGDSPNLTLVASVADLSGMLTLPAVAEERLHQSRWTLVAELIGRDGAVISASERAILIDDEPPKIELVDQPSDTLEVRGPMLELRIKTEDECGVDGVWVGLPDEDDLHALSKEPQPFALREVAPLEEGPSRRRQWWFAEVPLKKLVPDDKLAPGRSATLRMRAVDRARPDNNVGVLDFRLTVAVPSKSDDDENLKPAWGRVLLAGTPVGGAVVKLKVGGTGKVVTCVADSDGYIKVKLANGVVCSIQSVEKGPAGRPLVVSEDTWTISDVERRSPKNARKIVVKPSS
jgi:hypothetical protein